MFPTITQTCKFRILDRLCEVYLKEKAPRHSPLNIILANKLRAFKTYMAGNHLAPIRAYTLEVARVRYGGFDHRQTSRDGTQLSLAVDQPEQYDLLAESIRLRAAGFLIRGEYRRNLLPGFRFFAHVTGEQDWMALGGMTPAYEVVFPYARIGAPSPLESEAFVNIQPEPFALKR